MGKLEYLNMMSNELNGSIPENLGNANALEELWLRSNDLEGCIPLNLKDVKLNDLSELGLDDCPPLED